MGQGTDIALAGRVIWVTRPQQQAEPLCRLIAAAGGQPIRLPVIEIQPVPDTRDRSTTAADLAAADLVIFVSRNAVNHAATAVPEFYHHIQGKMSLAVGTGTRLALEQQGLTNVISTAAGMGSEALLQLPELQPAAVTGKQVLIVRGGGGRDLLEQTLRSAGAAVQYLEVYQRDTPGTGAATVAKLWNTDQPDDIIITSVEGLHNLVNMTEVGNQAKLLQKPLAVLSDRIASAARALGFIPAPAVAKAASDAGLLQATISLFEG